MRRLLLSQRPQLVRTGSLLAVALAAFAFASASEAGDGGTTTQATTTSPATTSTAPGATTTTAAAPCVGAGVLAVVPPGGGEPAPFGPNLAASSRTATSAATFATGSILSTSNIRVGAAGCVDSIGRPGGTTTRLDSLSLLGGAVTATSVEGDLVPSTTADGSDWTSRPKVAGLRVGGKSVTPAPGQAVAVGTWGELDLQPRVDAGAGTALRWWSGALELRLTRTHAGLAAGTVLLVAYAAADRAYAPAAAPTTTIPATTTAPTTTTTAAPTPTAPSQAGAVPGHSPNARATKRHTKAKRAKRHRKKAKGSHPLKVTPALGDATYDFPVTGQVSWGDSYGADRSDVQGGWHHGDDLFAPLGTPIVAVADGMVFSVGWNRVGGWRLWLRDEQGNEFYYAHLSGYTGKAHNNGRVHRGQVLGFVGNTGDAYSTPDHLHFEVHPVGLLYLGYDGAVDPSSYLANWRHVDSLAAPPPAALPAGAALHGAGAVSDYRQLLALRLPASARKLLVHAAAHLPAGHRAAAVPRHPQPARIASAAATTSSHGSSALPVALASVACALAALAGVFFGIRRRRSTGEDEA